MATVATIMLIEYTPFFNELNLNILIAPIEIQQASTL